MKYFYQQTFSFSFVHGSYNKTQYRVVELVQNLGTEKNKEKRRKGKKREEKREESGGEKRNGRGEGLVQGQEIKSFFPIQVASCLSGSQIYQHYLHFTFMITLE